MKKKIEAVAFTLGNVKRWFINDGEETMIINDIKGGIGEDIVIKWLNKTFEIEITNGNMYEWLNANIIDAEITIIEVGGE